MTSETVYMRINKEVKDRLKELAKKDGRSLTNIINLAIRDFLKFK